VLSQPSDESSVFSSDSIPVRFRPKSLIRFRTWRSCVWSTTLPQISVAPSLAVMVIPSNADANAGPSSPSTTIV
jgi:hypothetical protein